MVDKLSSVMSDVASGISTLDKKGQKTPLTPAEKKAQAAKLAMKAEALKTTAANASESLKKASTSMRVATEGNGNELPGQGLNQLDPGQVAADLRAPLEALKADPLFGKPDGGVIADGFAGAALNELIPGGSLPALDAQSLAAFFSPSPTSNGPGVMSSAINSGPNNDASVAADVEGASTPMSAAIEVDFDAAKDAALNKYSKGIVMFDPKSANHAALMKNFANLQPTLQRIFQPAFRLQGLVPVPGRTPAGGKTGASDMGSGAIDSQPPAVSEKDLAALGAFTSKIQLEGGGIPDLDKMDIDEACSMVMFMCAKQAEDELGDLLKDMQQRIHDKRIKRAEIQARKEQMTQADGLLTNEYAQLQAEGLIRKDVTLEDYKKMRSVAWSEPTYDPKSDSVVSKGASLTEPSWVNETNCIPPQFRPESAQQSAGGDNQNIPFLPGLMVTGNTMLGGIAGVMVDAWKNDKDVVGKNCGLPQEVTDKLHIWYSSDPKLKEQYPNFSDFLQKKLGIGVARSLEEAAGNRSRLAAAIAQDQNPPITVGNGPKQSAPNTIPAEVLAVLSPFAGARASNAEIAKQTGLPEKAVGELEKLFKELQSQGYLTGKSFENFLFEKSTFSDVEFSPRLDLSNALNGKEQYFDNAWKNAQSVESLLKKLEGNGIKSKTLETVKASVASLSAKNPDAVLAKEFGLPTEFVTEMRKLYSMDKAWNGRDFETFLRGKTDVAGLTPISKGGKPEDNLRLALEHMRKFGELHGANSKLQFGLDDLKKKWEGKAAKEIPQEKKADETKAEEKKADQTDKSEGANKAESTGTGDPTSGLPVALHNAAKQAYDLSGLGKSGVTFEQFLQTNLGKGLSPQDAGKAIANMLRSSCAQDPAAFKALQSFEKQLDNWITAQSGDAATGNVEVNYNSRQDAPPGYEQAGSLQSMQNGVDKAKDQLDALGDMSELDQLRLQKLMDRRAKAFETISNLMKKSAQTGDKLIDNLK